jgi:hypothetical protein
MENTARCCFYFTAACVHGHVPCAIHFFESITDPDDRSRAFAKAAECGQLLIAQKLATKVCFSTDSILEAFLSACNSGHMPVILWLMSLFSDEDVVDLQLHTRGFVEACKGVHLAVAHYMLHFGDVVVNYDYDSAFVSACRARNLSFALWVHSLGDVDITAAEDIAFRTACSLHLQDIAATIYGLGPVDIHARNDEAFLDACRSGDAKLAKWLHGLDPMSQHTVCLAFWKTCAEDHKGLAEWLLSLAHFEIKVFFPAVPQLFRVWLVMQKASLQMMQWLYQLSPSTIRAASYNMLLIAIRKKCSKRVEWVLSLGSADLHDKDDYLFRDAVKTYPEFAKRLMAEEPDWNWPLEYVAELKTGN